MTLQTLTEASDDIYSGSISVDGHEPDAMERWVIHSALLAQVDDMHAGGVYSWTEKELKAAESLLSVLTGCGPGESPENYGGTIAAQVIVKSILVVLFDLDHPELSNEEWAEAEQLIGLQFAEFGR